MILFVVVDGGKTGAIALFSDEEKARSFAEREIDNDVAVQECLVNGDYKPGAPVFAVHERKDEPYHFIALYADRAGAMGAAHGDQKLLWPLGVDQPPVRIKK